MSDDLFDETVAVKENPMDFHGRLPKDAPDPTSVDWNDYVLSLLDETEVLDGDTDDPKPLVAGLRRVSDIIFGPPIESGPVQVITSNDADSPGRVTVLYTVVFPNGMKISEVADVWIGNTDDKYAAFAAATASTRAESRALRKALRLKVVAAEELTSKDTATEARNSARTQESKKDTDGEYGENAMATSKQDRFIDTLCERLEIDRGNFSKEVFQLDASSVLTKNMASKMIDKLNTYQQDASKIPSEVKE